MESPGGHVGGGVAERIMGLGIGFIFPTVSAAAFSCVARERMGYAASLYQHDAQYRGGHRNCVCDQRADQPQQIHQSYLVEHFSVFDAWKLSNLGQGRVGAPEFHYLPQIVTGQMQGLGMIYGSIQAQSAMLSFNDIYRFLAVLMALLIPSFLLLRKGSAAGGGGAGH